MIKKVLLSLIFTLSLVCVKVHAVELVTGKVKLLESSYMPDVILFQLNVGTTSCPSGTWLSWRNPNVNNMKATYATLLVALSSRKSINTYLNSSCEAQNLHLIG